MLDKQISPMLARPSEPFDSDDHIFEIKWDGTRCLLFADKSDIWLQNRHMKDISFRYPEITALRRRIKAKNAILDGEVVVLSGGKPIFYRLQKRIHLQKPASINRYARTMTATYVVFDVLYLNGEKLLHVPLYRRKELIDGIIEPDRSLIVSHPFECKGSKLFKEARKYELEGIIAKKADSPYLIGVRSKYWLKIKSRHEAVCYIVGLKMGSGYLGENIGALILAERQGANFCYCGDVGFWP